MMYEKYKDECFKDVCLDRIKLDIEKRFGEELEIPKIKDIEITMNNGQEILYNITFTDNSVREFFDSSARVYEECAKEIIRNEGGKNMINEEKKEEFARLLMEEYDLKPSEAYDYMNRFFRWLEEKGPIRLTIDEEVRIINEIVAQAVLHGGDNGGPYYSNTVSLYKILKSWLTEKEYADDYKIVLDRYIDCDRREIYENMFTIVPKDNKTEEYHIPKSDFAF